MKIVISIVACFFSITTFAQTKLISFRSHSGSNANFRLAVEHDMFDINKSNFGIVPVEYIDSVIRVSNDRIVVFKRRAYPGNRGPKYFSRDTLTRTKANGIFAATNMQGLKAAVHNRYQSASLDSTLFVGFKNKFNYKK